jgi:uncharacterized protein GlcG (DUF336 family)
MARRGVGRLLQVALGLALLMAAVPVGRAAQPQNQLPQPQALTTTDVTRILRQGVFAAQQRNAKATFAIVDRVGNVLAMYQMTGAVQQVTVSAAPRVQATVNTVGKAINGRTGLAGAPVPATAAAIAKAITGAYLSSGGNAFSTRTASQIVQQNFDPGSVGLEGGPLFGVQFSSLPCSDLMVRFKTDSDPPGTVSPLIGPKRTPLGLSADPGGQPLYKGVTLVGGIGVVADNLYTLDPDIRDTDRSIDEQIAVTAGFGYAAPTNFRADRVTVDGRTLRFSDFSPNNSFSFISQANGIDLAQFGQLVAVNGYFDGRRLRNGRRFGFPLSGIEPDPDGIYGTPLAYVLTTAGGRNRFPPRDGTTGAGAITRIEVIRLLREALNVALTARGQIRRPLDSHAEVTISVVDTNGRILGIVRTPDAPVFGTDVSLQKARTASFFSSTAPPFDLARVGLDQYFADFRAFLGPSFVPGRAAFAARPVGNASRPFYPDGQNSRSNGPLSVTIRRWSPFNTGLQLDLVFDDIIRHVFFVAGVPGVQDVVPVCTSTEFVDGVPGTRDDAILRLANGLQIFSGGAPIYRGSRLVGGIGVSGDGIDQDDMVGFLGLSRYSERFGTLNNAPRSIRADRFKPSGANLRYVQCPYKPFLGSNAQDVCHGR